MTRRQDPDADAAADDLRGKLAGWCPNYDVTVEPVDYNHLLKVRVTNPLSRTSIRLESPHLTALQGLSPDQRAANALREIETWIADGHPPRIVIPPKEL